MKALIWRFECFPLLLCVQVVVAQSIGLFISTSVPDISTAQVTALVLILGLMLVGGLIASVVWAVHHPLYLYLLEEGGRGGVHL